MSINHLLEVPNLTTPEALAVLDAANTVLEEAGRKGKAPEHPSKPIDGEKASQEAHDLATPADETPIEDIDTDEEAIDEEVQAAEGELDEEPIKLSLWEKANLATAKGLVKARKRIADRIKQNTKTQNTLTAVGLGFVGAGLYLAEKTLFGGNSGVNFVSQVDLSASTGGAHRDVVGQTVHEVVAQRGQGGQTYDIHNAAFSPDDRGVGGSGTPQQTAGGGTPPPQTGGGNPNVGAPANTVPDLNFDPKGPKNGQGFYDYLGNKQDGVGMTHQEAIDAMNDQKTVSVLRANHDILDGPKGQLWMHKGALTPESQTALNEFHHNWVPADPNKTSGVKLTANTQELIASNDKGKVKVQLPDGYGAKMDKDGKLHILNVKTKNEVVIDIPKDAIDANGKLNTQATDAVQKALESKGLKVDVTTTPRAEKMGVFDGGLTEHAKPGQTGGSTIEYSGPNGKRLHIQRTANGATIDTTHFIQKDAKGNSLVPTHLAFRDADGNAFYIELPQNGKLEIANGTPLGEAIAKGNVTVSAGTLDPTNHKFISEATVPAHVKSEVSKDMLDLAAKQDAEGLAGTDTTISIKVEEVAPSGGSSSGSKLPGHDFDPPKTGNPPATGGSQTNTSTPVTPSSQPPTSETTTTQPSTSDTAPTTTTTPPSTTETPTSSTTTTETTTTTTAAATTGGALGRWGGNDPMPTSSTDTGIATPEVSNSQAPTTTTTTELAPTTTTTEASSSASSAAPSSADVPSSVASSNSSVEQSSAAAQSSSQSGVAAPGKTDDNTPQGDGGPNWGLIGGIGGPILGVGGLATVIGLRRRAANRNRPGQRPQGPQTTPPSPRKGTPPGQTPPRPPEPPKYGFEDLRKQQEGPVESIRQLLVQNASTTTAVNALNTAASRPINSNNETDVTRARTTFTTVVNDLINAGIDAGSRLETEQALVDLGVLPEARPQGVLTIEQWADVMDKNDLAGAVNKLTALFNGLPTVDKFVGKEEVRDLIEEAQVVQGTATYNNTITSWLDRANLDAMGVPKTIPSNHPYRVNEVRDLMDALGFGGTYDYKEVDDKFELQFTNPRGFIERLASYRPTQTS